MMLAGGLFVATVGITLARRYQQTSITTSTTSEPTVVTLNRSSPRKSPRKQLADDSLLDSVLEDVLAQSSTLKYVHNFYDVQKEYSTECECEFGFSRQDFKKDSMVGRVSYHDKHIFVLTKQRATDWEKDFDKEGFVNVLKTGLKKSLKSVRCKISYAEAVDGEDAGDETNTFTVLVLPDMIKYTGVTESNIQQLADSIANKAFPTDATLVKEPLDGAQIFICCHTNKDTRCGVCGPRIYKEFAEQIPQTRFKDQPVSIRRVTHIGGHKFAGNVIIYQYSAGNQKVFGDWYGYVDLKDVSRLINEHMIGGRIVKDLWRGRAGMKADFAEKFLQFQ